MVEVCFASVKNIEIFDVFRDYLLSLHQIAVGTGTWGIAAVIPKYLSLRLPETLFTQ